METTPTSTSRNRLVAVLVGHALIAAACGGSGDGAATASGDEGSIAVSGSSTVFPIVQLQAERFIEVDPTVAISVRGPGSGDGARQFCAGEVQITNASRQLKDEEIAICDDAGISFIELKRGIDGISVVTSADNDAIECLSFNDLYALLSEDAIGFSNWSDANALTGEWGGQQFPDAQLDVFAPGEESGTFDSFNEVVLEAVVKGKTGLEGRDSEIARPDYTASPDDNVIIEGITASQYSLGWVGFAFAKEAEASGKIKLLEISKDDGGDCVSPTEETIASADFPISRFLYTYVSVEAAESQPAVAAFVDYMMSDAGLTAVEEVGYVSLPADEIAAVKANWESRTPGKQ